MKPIRVPDLAPEQLAELEELYRSTRSVRLRTRAQMVLLAAEQRLTAREIAEIVRSSEETVRRWLKRYLAEGVEGLSDAPQPGAPRMRSAAVRAAWGCRSRCGPCGGWPTTWPSKPAYGWSTRPSGCI
jgi:transposase